MEEVFPSLAENVRFRERFGVNCIFRADRVEGDSAWFAQPAPNRFDDVDIIFHWAFVV